MSEKKIFKGISTIGSDVAKKTWKKYDEELVKADLLNHFHTRRGERVMMSNYGCKIWDLLFEPFTETVRQEIISDVERICKADNRVELLSTYVHETDNGRGLRVEVLLHFAKLNTQSGLSVVFQRDDLSHYS